MIGIKMDMPKRCGECSIERIVMSASYVCQITREITNDIREEIRGNHCPLCELPEDEKICVGDEILNTVNGWKYVVTYVYPDGDLSVLHCPDGRATGVNESNVKRTGRHFGEVETMLKKMRGEDDD